MAGGSKNFASARSLYVKIYVRAYYSMRESAVKKRARVPGPLCDTMIGPSGNIVTSMSGNKAIILFFTYSASSGHIA